MNELDSQLSTAQELIAFAKQQGVDLTSVCHDWAFLSDGRFISLWRNEGKVHYNMQGPVRMLPERYQGSASAFHGMWTEAGTLPNLEEAFAFLEAWLIDRKEVDELPQRSVRREGIG